ncbi:MAG: nuclear transport factor 2 family protein [Actinomycetota bacterium]
MDTEEIGRTFVEALTARDFDALRSALSEDVRFRLLVPRGPQAHAGAEETVGRFVGWFQEADSFDLEESSVRPIGDRVAVGYRFRLHDADGWQEIEQHLMMDVGLDARVEAIDLLCSGFRSVATCELGGVHRFDAANLGCADGLAGEFRTRINGIPVGDVLVVTARDPAAKEDLPPLARMMGHVVRAIETLGDGRLMVTVERGR